MNEVRVKLENCYGIKQLESVFNFSQKPTYAIYSPNGTMKTSFAKTFMDYSNNEESKDLVFSDRTTMRSIQDENETDLEPERIFVVEPYNQSYRSGKLSTLLVNQELKERYDAIHRNIDEKKEKLLNELKKLPALRSMLKKLSLKLLLIVKNNFIKHWQE